MEAGRLLPVVPILSPLLTSSITPYQFSSFSFAPRPVRSFFPSSSSLPPASSADFKGPKKPRRNPIADWVSRNDTAARAIPIFTGGISLISVLLNRTFSGIPAVAVASSSQSRADILTLALAVTNLLTGLVWLSIQPKYISQVAPHGIECRWIDSTLPECSVLELLWAWESLSAATCCRSFVVVYGGNCLLQVGVAAESSEENGGALAVDAHMLTQGSLYKAVLESEKQSYLANLSLYPGRTELPFLPSNTQVTTKDGYVLSVQRIPAGGRNGPPSQSNKGPVLLQHGLFVDGFTWLVNSPSESLGYILADNGYDVWIANSRGTIYSLAHTSLSSNDPVYWDWSWDELAAYDLPAVVGYAYQQSGFQKLHYVGHSLGTLIALASLSEQKLINMIRSAALLSPIAYVNQIPSLFLQGAARIYLGEQLYWLGIARLNPSGTEVKKLIETICTGFDCYDLMTVFTGKNCCLNSSTVQELLNHEPQSTSTKNMVHIAQTMRRGVISKYDYDSLLKNLAHYGRLTPPRYNLANIPNDFPVFMGYGKDDVLSDVGDVKQLLGVLRGHDASDLTVHFVDSYAHADFIMAVNANKLVYDPLMDFFSVH